MLIRIDGVITSVDQSHFEIDKRISGDRTACGGFDDSFFDRGPEILRNRTAEDLVDPFKPTASGKRLEDALTVAELAAPTRLFLMPALNLDLLCDRFFIRNLRRMQSHLNVIAVIQLRYHRFDMQLARA